MTLPKPKPMPETVISVETNLFQTAKQAFQDHCELELTDQEFIGHAMRYICNHINHDNQVRALKQLGKTPIIITHEELSAIAEKVQRLQFANLPPYKG